MHTQIPKANTSTSSKVPLNSQEQWDNFTTHHCGTWQGLLLRYDSAGKVLDVLDSVRSFTLSEDCSTVTHALDFTSRMTGEIRRNQWTVTPGNPLISHPIDPSAYILFNQNAADVMVGAKLTNEAFYFEPYLIAGEKRVSLVVMYKDKNSSQPKSFSLFREIKQGSEQPWWSEDTSCTITNTSLLNVPAPSAEQIYISLEEMAQMRVSSQALEVQGDFLHFQFPSAINLTVSSNRFEAPYYASMWWIPEPGKTPRICSLIYTDSNQKAEILSA